MSYILNTLKKAAWCASLKQQLLSKYLLGVFLFFALAGCFSANESNQNILNQDTTLLSYFDSTNGPIRPLPQNIPLDPARVELGKVLFHDKRLSKDNSVACASCHNLDMGGTDRLSRSIGINGAIGGINAPTVLNSGFNFVQFWDGRAKDLEEQAAGPVHNPIEMGSNWSEVISKLSKDQDLVKRFRNTYNDNITNANIQDAIATYERALITPNSPFDRFLRGDKTAMSEKAQEGYRLFKDYGCVACHQGVNIGGNMYQRFGVMGDYFNDRGNISKDDYGRFNVTGRESDRFKFKVPSLRNVALTSPYFHDGSAKTLQEAVVIMSRYQLGKPISGEQLEYIIAFLESLTGELEASLK